MTLRPIEAIPLFEGFKVADKDNIGEPPTLLWLELTDLWVDDNYQRDLNRKSIDLIKDIVGDFRWDWFTPPTVCRSEGKYKVIDGQHSAVAAKTVGLKRIPCLLIAGSELEVQAAVFVAKNTNRRAMSQLDIYRANILAGNDIAATTDQLCRDIGVRIRVTSPHAKHKVGDCGSVGTIMAIIRAKGTGVAGSVLRTLVLAERAPITSVELQAVTRIITSSPGLSPTEFGKVIAGMGTRGLDHCLADAKKRRIKPTIVLMDTYLKRLKEAGIGLAA